MDSTYRMTASGPQSLIPHVSILTALATSETVVICHHCRESHREPWPGSMQMIDAWMRAHRHDAKKPHEN